MTTPARTLREPRLSRVRADLDRLDAQMDPVARLRGDPLSFVRAWSSPADQEVAGAIASGLSFGRVAAFWPVVQALMDRATARGGPAQWVRAFDAEDARALAPLRYRWLDGADLALWCATLGAALRAHGRLGAIAEAGWRPSHRDVGPALDHLVDRLRALAPGEAVRLGLARGEAGRLGLAGGGFEALPRGFRTFLPRPSDGSACKRWCMMLRWMVRRPGPPGSVAGCDLGLWALPPARLVVPLDTHVARLSWFLGLTGRRDGSWRTAVEITRNLARLDPADPLRYDFALAHLGISGRCTVRAEGDKAPAVEVCQGCPLGRTCRVGAAAAGATGVHAAVIG